MIITRTPLRITFVGGGTDMRHFFEQEHGAVVNAAINKYVYITVNRKFDDGIRLKYSKTEEVDHVDDIEHPLFREALRTVGLTGYLEITSHADIYAQHGSGLGSSSSFLVGLLHALYAYRGVFKSPSELAKIAVHIERDILKESGGYQDQYIAAFGGLRYMEFYPESVQVSRLYLREETRRDLQNHLMLFYIGRSRKSAEVQAELVRHSHDNFERLRNIKWQALRLREELERNNHEPVGTLMHEYWLHKRGLSNAVTTGQIDQYYEKARAAGAVGGKILGAGGGGFFLFYVPTDRQEDVRQALQPLRAIPFEFEREGSKVIYVADNFLPEA